VASPVLTSSWPFLGPSQSAQLSFGSQLDAAKLEEARMLLSGMDYSRTTGQDEDGDTILHIYTAKGLRECAFAAAERLRELGRLDAKEHKGKTALLVAVTANQPEIVQDLLSLGADVNACDVNGQTALHLAANYGFPRVLQVILSSGAAVNIEASNFEGNCMSEHLYLFLRITYSGVPRVIEKHLKEIKSNKTVLHLAVKDGNIDLVRHLLRIPLPNLKEFVNMKAHGHTALHMAAGLHGSPHQEEMLRLLLGRGADPSIRNLENDPSVGSGPRVYVLGSWLNNFPLVIF
uniref:Uncharacterized protein n=1 Tax=Myripristis murdjan TaxID=586833 RepID=A0A667XWM7_9TELE